MLDECMLGVQLNGTKNCSLSLDVWVFLECVIVQKMRVKSKERPECGPSQCFRAC